MKIFEMRCDEIKKRKKKNKEKKLKKKNSFNDLD